MLTVFIREVHKARSRKTGTLVALKKIIMHNEKDGFPITALREIKLLKLLSHKNVLRLEDMAVEHHSKMSELFLLNANSFTSLTPTKPTRESDRSCTW